MNNYCIIFTNTDSKDLAVRIAGQLISEKLAPCINIDEIHSMYTWKGAINERAEFRLMIKALDSNYSKIEKKILEMHTDDTPEIIKIDIKDGLKSYLNWIGEDK